MVVLVTTIHVFFGEVATAGPEKVVDGRHKADHDGFGWAER
jgi:hypothetical protein